MTGEVGGSLWCHDVACCSPALFVTSCHCQKGGETGWYLQNWLRWNYLHQHAPEYGVSKVESMGIAHGQHMLRACTARGCKPREMWGPKCNMSRFLRDYTCNTLLHVCTDASSARFACFSSTIHTISEPWIMPPKSFGPESWSLETESVLTASVAQSSTHTCSLLCAYRTGMLKRSDQQHAGG